MALAYEIMPCSMLSRFNHGCAAHSYDKHSSKSFNNKNIVRSLELLHMNFLGSINTSNLKGNNYK